MLCLNRGLFCPQNKPEQRPSEPVCCSGGYLGSQSKHETADVLFSQISIVQSVGADSLRFK